MFLFALFDNDMALTWLGVTDTTFSFFCFLSRSYSHGWISRLFIFAFCRFFLVVDYVSPLTRCRLFVSLNILFLGVYIKDVCFSIATKRSFVEYAL